MTETIYFPEVRCEVSPSSFYPDGVTAMLRDVEGRQQFIQLTRGMLNRHGDQDFLPVGFVRIDHQARRVLIELPAEADSGANRMWVSFDDLYQETPGGPGVVA